MAPLNKQIDPIYFTGDLYTGTSLSKQPPATDIPISFCPQCTTVFLREKRRWDQRITSSDYSVCYVKWKQTTISQWKETIVDKFGLQCEIGLKLNRELTHRMNNTALCLGEIFCFLMKGTLIERKYRQDILYLHHLINIKGFPTIVSQDWNTVVLCQISFFLYYYGSFSMLKNVSGFLSHLDLVGRYGWVWLKQATNLPALILQTERS